MNIEHALIGNLVYLGGCLDIAYYKTVGQPFTKTKATYTAKHCWLIWFWQI